jgi:hypothetical protein
MNAEPLLRFNVSLIGRVNAERFTRASVERCVAIKLVILDVETSESIRNRFGPNLSNRLALPLSRHRSDLLSLARPTRDIKSLALLTRNASAFHFVCARKAEAEWGPHAVIA